MGVGRGEGCTMKSVQKCSTELELDGEKSDRVRIRQVSTAEAEWKDGLRASAQDCPSSPGEIPLVPRMSINTVADKQEIIQSATNNILHDTEQGSHSFTDKKIQDFSRTFQDLHEKFSRTFSEPANV